MTTSVYLLVFEGYADWEPAYALAELRRSGGLAVETVGFASEPVRSMGGIRVVPDLTLAELDPARVRLLILPGGDQWEGDYPREPLETLLHRLAREIFEQLGVLSLEDRRLWYHVFKHGRFPQASAQPG